MKGKYYDAIIDEAVREYGDYFETEGKYADDALRNASIENKVNLLEGFKDYTQQTTEQRVTYFKSEGFFRIPKYRQNKELGLTRNFLNEATDMANYVLPNANEITANLQHSLLKGKADQYLEQTEQSREPINQDKQLPSK